MIDVFAVAKLLVDHATENHGADVDIVGCHGSRVRGDARDDSDLDIFYIPADGADPPIARAFLLDGILFDFWPIRRDAMEGFATGRVRGWAFAPALIHQTEVLHARSDEQAARFAGLKQRVLDLQTLEARPEMIRRALETFPNVAAHVANVRLAASDGDMTDARYAGWKVVQTTWECLALANQVFFGRGLGKSLGQTNAFKDKPDRLDQFIVTITTSPDLAEVLGACEDLANGTRQTLRQIQGSVPPTTTVVEQFRQVYPEMRDLVGKLVAACERGDSVAASAEAWLLQSDVTMMLDQTEEGAGHGDFNRYGELGAAYRAQGFPDLMSSASGNLEELAEQARLFDSNLRRFLATQSVSLGEFQTIEELRAVM
ncbi:MAG: nucleotidyltransferase domain-containing protein [SAR202 cluster bacterium]|nr:nucleotidyltransferase domain-containing protein [SAR202 cluster bacterium]MDP6664895.1 nucleotidyltransferase domain-containing protein [SAR202 cluster bacterium]MQG57998.1 nucleotidyltransferase domain-containing protein [SAR202 cluster bacterium]MQG69067.1 nucleotidyltransferase domain-containing protein [SAR202 cluster bacterium]